MSFFVVDLMDERGAKKAHIYLSTRRPILTNFLSARTNACVLRSHQALAFQNEPRHSTPRD